MNANILDTQDPRELGAALKRAREARGYTQQQAADFLDVARTTITAIEGGERRIKATELIQLARAYARDVTDFIGKKVAAPQPFQPQFRSSYRTDSNSIQIDTRSIDELEMLSKWYYELEQITDDHLVYNYPDSNRYKVDDFRYGVEQMAENIATQERNRLGLGDAPIPVLRELLEREVGIRIFYIKISPPEFSAMYAYDEQLGACIAANILHPEERRRWSIAHEYAHFLSQRYQVDLVGNEFKRLPQKERFADAFAAYFLMPTSGLRRQIGSDPLRRKDLFVLANYFGVSVEALTRRLESLEFIPNGTYDEMRRRAPKFRELQEQLQLTPIPQQNAHLPLRYQFLAVMAMQQELISEGQFTLYMGMDRLEARKLIASLTSPDSEQLDLAEFVHRYRNKDSKDE